MRALPPACPDCSCRLLTAELSDIGSALARFDLSGDLELELLYELQRITAAPEAIERLSGDRLSLVHIRRLGLD
jgi:hypothetical protein